MPFTDHLKTIDAQHNHLRKLMDYMCQESCCQFPIDEQLAGLDDLINQFHDHFEFEEAAMKTANYFDISGHRVAHRNFTKLLKHFRDQVTESRDPHEFRNIIELVNRFAVEHIDVEDRLIKHHLLPLYANIPPFHEESNN